MMTKHIGVVACSSVHANLGKGCIAKGFEKSLTTVDTRHRAHNA